MANYRNPLARLFYASFYSIRGLYFAAQQEQAFRYETFVLFALCFVLWTVRLRLTQALILVGAWLLVIAFELVNSAVERTFDLIDTSFRPEIQAGKDMLSAAVFLMVCFNIALWGIMFA